jgi:hypothetical protein
MASELSSKAASTSLRAEEQALQRFASRCPTTTVHIRSCGHYVFACVSQTSVHVEFFNRAAAFICVAGPVGGANQQFATLKKPQWKLSSDTGR